MLTADQIGHLSSGAPSDDAKAKPVLLFGEPVGVTT